MIHEFYRVGSRDSNAAGLISLNADFRRVGIKLETISINSQCLAGTQKLPQMPESNFDSTPPTIDRNIGIFTCESRLTAAFPTARELVVPDSSWSALLLGASFQSPPEWNGNNWVKVLGEFDNVSGVVISANALAEFLGAIRRINAGAAPAGTFAVAIREVFKGMIFAAWPPLSRLVPVKNGECSRLGLFDEDGVQVIHPHSIAHLPRVPKRSNSMRRTREPVETESGRLRQINTVRTSLISSIANLLTHPDWTKNSGLSSDPPIFVEIDYDNRGPVASLRASQLSVSHECSASWDAVRQSLPPSSPVWLDERNDHRPGVWRNRFETAQEIADGHDRVKIVDKSEAAAAVDYIDGSVDAVWLNADHSWRGMTESLDRWWPKIKEGGMLAGVGCRNAFEGNSRELYTWAVSQKVLETWTAARGLALIRGRDKEKSWAIFKTTPPRPEDITVITGFTRNVDYADVTTANHRLYCERHGYKYRTFGDEDFAKDRAYCWGKIDFARRALESSPWVFWIDVDAIFNRLDVKLERLCWPAFSLIAGLWETPQGARPSMGTFLAQAKPETEELLKAVWEWPGNRYDGAHEEDAIHRVLRTHPEWRERVMCINCSEINSRPPHKDWHVDDPILHFLEIRGTRRAVLEDACRMARERPESALRPG